eukprot:361402-Chlamydomonas_euryale.AAC.4
MRAQLRLGRLPVTLGLTMHRSNTPLGGFSLPCPSLWQLLGGLPSGDADLPLGRLLSGAAALAAALSVAWWRRWLGCRFAGCRLLGC